MRKSLPIGLALVLAGSLYALSNSQPTPGEAPEASSFREAPYSVHSATLQGLPKGLWIDSSAWLSLAPQAEDSTLFLDITVKDPAGMPHYHIAGPVLVDADSSEPVSSGSFTLHDGLEEECTIDIALTPPADLTWGAVRENSSLGQAIRFL